MNVLTTRAMKGMFLCFLTACSDGSTAITKDAVELACRSPEAAGEALSTYCEEFQIEFPEKAVVCVFQVVSSRCARLAYALRRRRVYYL